MGAFGFFGQPREEAEAVIDQQEDEYRTRKFLARFLERGWLHATRDIRSEQWAVNWGLKQGWLRRELGEVHFTPKGRRELSGVHSR